MAAEFDHFKFVSSESPLWYPESDTYDWRKIYVARLALKHESEPNGLIMVVGGHTQEITEANTTLFLNRAMDEMDAVRIMDERDDLPEDIDGYWWWFRGLDDGFDNFARTIATHATTVLNNCPQSGIEQQFHRHRALRTQLAQGLADDEISDMSRFLDDPTAVAQWLTEARDD